MFSRRIIIRRWLIGIAAAAVVIPVAVSTNWSGTPGEARLIAFEPMVNFGAPNTSTNRSLTVIIVSAAMTSLQLLLPALSDERATP